jgi:hypothetical protein
MPDFPVSGEAITKVLSNVLPPRTYTYLSAMIPGLFFELSILIGNPSYVRQLLDKTRAYFAFDRYTILAVALFLAFVIGNGFMLFVGLIQWLFRFVYKLRAFLWRQFCKWPLLPFSNWIRRQPFWGKRQWVHEFGNNITDRAGPFGSSVPEGVRKCWARFARQILKTYGIDHEDLDQEEWNALYGTLGTLTLREQRGSVFMIASEAIGWCGLAAAFLAPTLRTRYYLEFAILLVIAGIIHDWCVAKRLNDPTMWGLLEIRVIARELERTSRVLRRAPTRHPDASLGSESTSTVSKAGFDSI